MLNLYYFSHLKGKTDQKANSGIERIFCFHSALTTLFSASLIDHVLNLNKKSFNNDF